MEFCSSIGLKMATKKNKKGSWKLYQNYGFCKTLGLCFFSWAKLIIQISKCQIICYTQLSAFEADHPV